MSTPVVCVSSRYPSEPYYRFDVFLKSLDRLGIAPIILGMDEPWSGLMTKPFRFRNWLRDGHCPHERLIVCDCWDVIFTEHPDQVSSRCEEIYGDAVVFNGERGCWPRVDLADSFPDIGSPWRYLNSGFMCGPTDKILALLESMKIEEIGMDRTEGGARIEPNDQGEFQALFVKQPVKMVVDGACQIAQSFSACTPDGFDITPTFVVNLITGSRPGVLHFNGGSKNDIMPLVLREMSL